MTYEVFETLERMYAKLLDTSFYNHLGDIAVAWQMRHDAVAPEIPRVLSFPCELPDSLFCRLEKAIATPTGFTENALPGMDEDIEQYGRIVGISDYPLYWGALMINFIHAENTGHEESGCVFKDLSRLYPQYAGEWMTKLARRSGADVLREARQQYPRLFSILDGTQAASEFHYSENGNPLTIFDTTSYVALELEDATSRYDGRGASVFVQAAKALQPRFRNYRTAVCLLRGIEPDYSGGI